MGTLSWTRGDGPLVPFAKGFCQELAHRGHPPSTQKGHLKLMGQLNRWLFAEGLAVSCLTSERANDFLAWRRALGQRRVPTLASLAPLFDYLRAEHALPADQPGAVTPRNELLAHYRQHLVVERGLMTTTVTRYERFARRFLSERAARTGLETGAEGLTSAEVKAYMLEAGSRLVVESAKREAADLRALLRFLYLRGLIDNDLGSAMPPVAAWRGTSLPSAISQADVGSLLDSCDGSTTRGRRDRAVLMFLARLGLRSAEVAAMQLGDIDWHAGEVNVRGRAGRRDRLKASQSLLFYQVDNEPAYHAHSVVSLAGNWFCYCEHCQRGYAAWLEARYEHEKRPLVAKPFPRPYEMGELAWLEWRKFHDDTNIRRTKWVCDEVRKFDPDHKLTTNIMVGSEFGPSTSQICHDVTGLAQSLDVMGMDFYPDMRGNSPKRDRLVFSLSDQLGHPGGFHCLETQGTTYAVPMGNWDGQEKGFRAYGSWDKLAPQFWRAVAYGAQSLFYWVWRLRADNVWSLSRPDGSLVEESVVRTAALSADVARLWPSIRGAQRSAPRVAVLFTRDSSHLATRHGLAEANGEAVLNSFDAASRYEQPVDVVELGRWDGDLDRYSVVFAPFLYVLSTRGVELLEAFVAHGGTLVWGARSGSYPEPPQGWEEVPVASDVRLPSDAVPPPPLDRVLGFTRQGLRLSDPASTLVGQSQRPGTGLPIYTFYDEVLLNKGAEVVEAMPDGWPAVVHHRYGEGDAWSVLVDAFSSFSPWLVRLTGRILRSSGLGREFLAGAGGATDDDGWEIVRRDLPHGELVFLINSSERNWPARVGVPKESAVEELLEDRDLGLATSRTSQPWF